MALAVAAVLGTMQVQEPQVVRELVTVERRTTLQLTVHIIAAVVAVAAAVAAPSRTEVMADPASSSFACKRRPQRLVGRNMDQRFQPQGSTIISTYNDDGQSSDIGWALRIRAANGNLYSTVGTTTNSSAAWTSRTPPLTQIAGIMWSWLPMLATRFDSISMV